LSSENEAISEHSKSNASGEAVSAAAELHTPEKDQPLAAATEPVDSLELIAKLDRLLAMVENRLTYDEGKEELIRRLGEEVKTYRDDFFRSLQRPLLLDLLLLYDTLQTVRRDLRQTEPLTAECVNAKLDAVNDELVEVLARQEVLPYAEHPEKLDLRRHRTVKVEKTANQEEDKQVVQIIRDGFTWGESILRPEAVVIKRYEAG